MNTTTTTETCTNNVKFSRYRSVRRAAATSSASLRTEDISTDVEKTNSQLNRTPSRYHRTQRPRVQTAPVPIQPVLQSDSREEEGSSPSRNDTTVAGLDKAGSKDLIRVRTSENARQRADHATGGGLAQSRAQNIHSSTRQDSHIKRVISNSACSSTSPIPKSAEAAREEARMMLEGEYDRIQNNSDPSKADDEKSQSKPLIPERQPIQTQRPQPVASQPAFVDAPNLHVKRRIEKVLPEKYHDAPKSVGQTPKSPEQGSQQETLLDRMRTKRVAPRTTIGVPAADVQQQQSGPRYDAPISAVNAGDRRVEVRLHDAETGITLPITPTTNSKDLLNSASVVMSADFDPRTSVLVELFSQAGLERPLRKYEHIRDIMNSWDNDDQNYLIITSAPPDQIVGLERRDVPEETPGRMMLQMYLSLRPGKWEKRWIILRPDGQVTMSKNENDGEGTNICHLSDFDVYTLTARQRKKLRPPKKLCFAIKSQQKSAMFLDGANFVHFFSTNDKQVADQWYNAVQTWRSWYLVHVLGEGTKKVKEDLPKGTTTNAADVRPSTAQSAETMPYQLGSFQPLLDLSDLKFDATVDEADAKLFQAHENGYNARKSSAEIGKVKGRPNGDTSEATWRASRQARGKPPPSFPSKLFREVENKLGSVSNNNDQPFTGGGLLARSASMRKSQGSKISGHGIPGVPGKPLVDLRPTSNFAEGSLLRKLEAWTTSQGENEPKIDRQKRKEAEIKVGEGLG